MWTYNYDNAYSIGGELYHHGVPGMKWGIRKVRDAIGGRVTNGSNTLGSVIRNIARKKHIYSVGTHRREKFTNIARVVPKSPILGNRIKSEYGARIVHKYLNQYGGVFIGVVSGQMSKPQRIMGYNGFKKYSDHHARYGYSIKLDNRRREALMPPSHGNMFRRLR